MGSEMEQSKTFVISGKIITMNDVRRFAALIGKKVERGKCKGKECRAEYTVEYEDGCCTSDNDNEVFASEEFNVKKIYSIRLEYVSWMWNERIQIVLRNSAFNQSLNSMVYVKSGDTEWFDSTCYQVNNVIRNIKNQWLDLKDWSTTAILLLVSFFPVYFLPYPKTMDKVDVVCNALIIFLLLLRMNIWVVERLFPSIEFSFGSESIWRGRRLKAWLWSSLYAILGIVASIVIEKLID